MILQCTAPELSMKENPQDADIAFTKDKLRRFVDQANQAAEKGQETMLIEGKTIYLKYFGYLAVYLGPRFGDAYIFDPAKVRISRVPPGDRRQINRN